MTNFTNLSKDSKKLENIVKSQYAEVIEVTTAGVNIRVWGEDVARGKYYNSLVNVNVGDKVYFQNVSGTILIIGSLKY